MQFSGNVVSEIVIPNNVPFEPGNDVIGIGFSIPPELQAIGFIAAVIFYNSQYSPTSTLPRVVYQFIAAGSEPDPTYQTAISMGYVWQENPSLGTPMQVAQCATAGAIAPAASGYNYLRSIFTVGNRVGNTIYEMTEDSAGNPILAVVDNAGDHVATKQVPTQSGGTNTGWTYV